MLFSLKLKQKRSSKSLCIMGLASWNSKPRGLFYLFKFLTLLTRNNQRLGSAGYNTFESRDFLKIFAIFVEYSREKNMANDIFFCSTVRLHRNSSKRFKRFLLFFWHHGENWVFFLTVSFHFQYLNFTLTLKWWETFALKIEYSGQRGGDLLK